MALPALLCSVAGQPFHQPSCQPFALSAGTGTIAPPPPASLTPCCLPRPTGLHGLPLTPRDPEPRPVECVYHIAPAKSLWLRLNNSTFAGDDHVVVRDVLHGPRAYLQTSLQEQGPDLRYYPARASSDYLGGIYVHLHLSRPSTRVVLDYSVGAAGRPSDPNEQNPFLSHADTRPSVNELLSFFVWFAGGLIGTSLLSWVYCRLRRWPVAAAGIHVAPAGEARPGLIPSRQLARLVASRERREREARIQLAALPTRSVGSLDRREGGGEPRAAGHAAGAPSGDDSATPRATPRLTETDCPLCLEPYLETCDVRLLPCGHFFHVACIDRWFAVSAHEPACPLCKANPLAAAPTAAAPTAASVSSAAPSDAAGGAASSAPAASEPTEAWVVTNVP